MRVLHVITDLAQGGAESGLFRLILATRPAVEHSVVSLCNDEVYGPKLRAVGVPIEALRMPRGSVTLTGVRRLRRLIREFDPDVVQTWLYHADLVGGVVSLAAGMPPVVWGVHSVDLGPMRTTYRTRLIRRTCAVMSHVLPTAIVCVAHSTARLHEALGYDGAKMCVIPNGIDLAAFRSDDEARDRLRSQWGVMPDDILLGSVARWDPLKDHANLLEALATVARRVPMCRCVLTGNGITSDNAQLIALVKRHGLGDRVLFLGQRGDIELVMNAIDVYVSSSSSEAAPTAPLEAMACGTPCVVTDVGDGSILVGETGWVVPPRDSDALAAGIMSAIAALRLRGKRELGKACRARVKERFDLVAMANAYHAVWSESAASRVRR